MPEAKNIAGQRFGMLAAIQDAANARREAEETIVDPWMEAHGYPLTDEGEFQAQVTEGLRREKDDTGKD